MILNITLAEERKIIKLELERVKDCLKYLGNPEKKFKSVIIGGTNGKGSVTYYLSNLACKFTNLKIARFTSPHLISWDERFVINEKPIEKNLLENITNEVINKIKEFESIDQSKRKLTEFEIYTIIAFELFNKEKIDIAFMEVGMGGRLDATNVIEKENVLCSVITNVSFDHTKFLGTSIEEIAVEKAGIIKENNYLVTCAKDKALSVIEEKAKRLNAKCIRVDVESLNDYREKNIELALCAWEAITGEKEKTEYKEYLRSLNFPGRFQLIKEDKILLDGAHNEGAARELRKLIDKKFSNKKIVYIIAMLDKDYKTFIKYLITEKLTVICTEVNSERKTKKEDLKQTVLENYSFAITTENIREAIKLAKMQEYDLIVITGSLYLVGEALIELKKIV